MPDKKGRLTAQETDFVDIMARTNDPDLSARVAGYRNPAHGKTVAARPEIVARVQAQVQHVLQTRGAEVGVSVLLEIAEGEKFPAAARALAAKELVKLSGVGVRGDDDSRPLHMLSAAELEARARKAQAWLDELDRNTIEHEPAPESPAGGFFD